jgi:hypothetical protein
VNLVLRQRRPIGRIGDRARRSTSESQSTVASASPERLADSMLPRTSSATLRGTTPPRPVCLVRTDGAIYGVLIAGNPAAGRGPGTTSLHYPRLLDRARSIRSDRCCALRFSDVRLARRGMPSQPQPVVTPRKSSEPSELRMRSQTPTAITSFNRHTGT